ncbi:hypothetical protein [Caballeronia telluris]|uniref:Uncharacterized protein n=1 Tax=Caballeronia telluris TaxID=326475 RepID=A0A158ET84_9BURK|nr:hypothetical protein [Caballeronia telluris]SAL10683.1 hypothetical protein AWB66_00220 [Caballeronia telluris]
MNKPDPQRELRKAVADLLRHPIEDVELVWNALSTDERERLKPILSAASGLNEQASARLATAFHAQPEQSVESGRDIALLAYQVATMPVELAARLLGSLESNHQRAISSRLPATRLCAMREHRDMDSVTEHARRAWLEVCVRVATDEPARSNLGDKRVTRAASSGSFPGKLLRVLRRFGVQA